LAAAAAPFGERIAIGRELLDAVVVAVGDVHIPVPVDDHGARVVELARSSTRGAPLAHWRAGGRQLLDAVVPVIGNVNRTVGVDTHAERLAEFAWPFA